MRTPKDTARRVLGIDALRAERDKALAERDRARTDLAALKDKHRALRESLKDTRRRFVEHRESTEVVRERLRVAQAERDTLRELVRGETGLPREVEETVLAVVARKLTMIPAAKIVETARVVHDLAEQGVEGDYLETGTALGGSGIVIASAKPRDRDLFVHDVFGQIPPPSDADGDDVKARYAVIAEGKAQGIDGDEYYGYQEDLRGKVATAFADCGWPVEDNAVHLVQGLFQDTVHPRGPVAFCHLDGDWYESTKVVLERVLPHLVVGGVLVVDDYRSWSGCRTAVDELLVDRPDLERVDGHGVRFVRTA